MCSKNLNQNVLIFVLKLSLTWIELKIILRTNLGKIILRTNLGKIISKWRIANVIKNVTTNIKQSKQVKICFKN